MEKRMWTRRILGILLIVGGFLFGASRGPAGVCPGDRIFSALGLPVWSQMCIRDSGYPSRPASLLPGSFKIKTAGPLPSPSS